MIINNYTIGDIPDAPRGWVCPKCGRVYSPNIPMCYYCGGNNTQIYTSPNTTGINPEKKWKNYITCNTALEKILNSSDTFRVHYEDLPHYDQNEEELNSEWR